MADDGIGRPIGRRGAPAPGMRFGGASALALDGSRRVPRGTPQHSSALHHRPTAAHPRRSAAEPGAHDRQRSPGSRAGVSHLRTLADFSAAAQRRREPRREREGRMDRAFVGATRGPASAHIRSRGPGRRRFGEARAGALGGWAPALRARRGRGGMAPAVGRCGLAMGPTLKGLPPPPGRSGTLLDVQSRPPAVWAGLGVARRAESKLASLGSPGVSSGRLHLPAPTSRCRSQRSIRSTLWL